jgi:hypothetical protein
MAKELIGTSPIIGPIYGVAPRANGNGGAPRSYLDSFREHLVEMPGDLAIHEAGPVTLAASALRQDVVGYTVQAGRLALIRGVAMGCRLLSDFDNVRLDVMVDDAVVAGLDNICGPFGAFLHPHTRPVLIPLNPGQRVHIVASNLTAVAIPEVTAYLHGYHWTMEG